MRRTDYSEVLANRICVFSLGVATPHNVSISQMIAYACRTHHPCGRSIKESHFQKGTMIGVRSSRVSGGVFFRTLFDRRAISPCWAAFHLVVTLPLIWDAKSPQCVSTAAQHGLFLLALAIIADLLLADLTLKDGPIRARVTHAADEGEDARVRLDGRIAVVAGRHFAYSDGPGGPGSKAEVWQRVGFWP